MSCFGGLLEFWGQQPAGQVVLPVPPTSHTIQGPRAEDEVTGVAADAAAATEDGEV